ncbi:MAG: hypothetical protein R3C12_09345 [Planctomycetaceae bacterium]|nr:hypothetical protein [Planctomycetaceae bacterium]
MHYRFPLAHRTVLCFSALLLVAGIWGCGGGERIPTAVVSGNVTWEGAPLEKGVIQFHPDQDALGKPLAGQAVETTIENGAYKLEANSGAVVGKNRVIITATKVVGKYKADGVEVDKVEQILPAKYNSETTLFIEVKSGVNEQNFDLVP